MHVSSKIPKPARIGLSANTSVGPEFAGIALASFLVLMLTMTRFANIYDEGIILTGAMRVLHGDIVHRDFYSPYGPAQYYVVAALLGWFHDGFLAARVYDLAIRACSIAAVFGILRVQVRLDVAIFFTLLCACFYIGFPHYLYPVLPCILLALLGSWLVVRHGAGGPSSLLGAGLCCGLVALFRYETGFLLFVANLLALAMFSALSPGRPIARFTTQAARYAVGTALVFAPAAIAFVLVSGLAPFKADIIDYPRHFYAAMRSLPFPGLQGLWKVPEDLAVYLPLLAFGLVVFELGRAVPRWAAAREAILSLQEASLVVFGLAAVFLFAKGLVRVSWAHMFMGVLPGLVALAILVDRWRFRTRSFRAGAAAVVLFASVCGLSPVWRLPLDATLLQPAPAACEASFGAGTALLPPAYARVARYLELHTEPEEPIFVATGRHDKVFVNAVALYFAARRLPGTHWHQFDPGLQTRADIQAAIIADLQRNRVRWVVRDPTFDNVLEPNASAISSGVTLLDEYLRHHYRRVAEAGGIEVLLENSMQPDTVPADPCSAGP